MSKYVFMCPECGSVDLECEDLFKCNECSAEFEQEDASIEKE